MMKSKSENLSEKRVSQRAFGQLVGVSEATVSNLVRDGRLPKDGSLGDWLRAFIDLQVDRAAPDDSQHEVERTLLLRARREMAELELRKARGEVMARAEVGTNLTAIALTLKSKVWSWQGVLPALLEHRPASEIAAVLKQEARTLLAEVSERGAEFAGPLFDWVVKNAPRELLWRDARGTAVDRAA